MKISHCPSAQVSARRRSSWGAVSIACATLLSGCAALENTKGHLQLRMGQTEEGVESLEGASRRAPRDAGYKVDYLLARDEKVREALTATDRLRAEGRLADAQAGYESVLKMDRGNARAKAALAGLPQDQRNVKLLTEGEAFLAQERFELALDRARQVLEDHPQNQRAIRLKEDTLDRQLAAETEKARVSISKSILEKPVTLQYNDAPLKMVFESLARSVGLNILLDRDVKPASRVSIFVKDIAVGDAIDFILMQNQLERRAINSNTLIVYPAGDAKRAEYEDLTIRSFQVTNADLRYLGNMLKSMLKLREVAADERTGILVIRDTPERLRLAAKLIAVHDVADPEIMLEVEILEVTSSRRSNIGIQPPTSFSVLTPDAGGSPLTLRALRALRSGDLLTSPLGATLNLQLEDTDAKLLASPRIRSKNKEKAMIMIGDRVPTITNTVTPLTTGTSVVTGSVSYQDVGLKLQFEPQVYAGDEVGIKISLEVSNIVSEFTDKQGGRSYQIGTRNANTVLRLKDGETQVLGGLITDQDRNVASKIPGLGHLPVVGRVFGNNDGSDVRSEIVLAITPKIVRNLPAHTPEGRNIFSGTLNGLRERPILAEPISQAKPVTQLGGTPAGGPAVLTPMTLPGGQMPSAGGVLFNPASQVTTPGPVPESSPALLPPPPGMFMRPAPAR